VLTIVVATKTYKLQAFLPAILRMKISGCWFIFPPGHLSMEKTTPLTTKSNPS
jgi:hypothetical protein